MVEYTLQAVGEQPQLLISANRRPLPDENCWRDGRNGQYALVPMRKPERPGHVDRHVPKVLRHSA